MCIRDRCWVCLVAVAADEAVTAGNAVTIGTTTTGRVEALDGHAEQQVGVAKQALVSGEFYPVQLTLDN